MKTTAALLLTLAATATASDCTKTLNDLCNTVSSGDIPAALECLTKHDAELTAASCQLPKEALDLLRMAVESPEELAEGLRRSDVAAIVTTENLGPALADFAMKVDDSKLPTVFGHGMGDSCFNSGMKQITADTGKHIGSYAVCVPTGDNVVSDTINGFLMNMDKSVDVFAKKIQADPKLAGGFNAVGFSQGNSLIRGYIHKYNNPPVRNVLHVHGTVSGVSGFPQCNPASSSLCKGISQLCGDLVYNGLVQGILFQADYFRDPNKITSAGYEQHSQLALWNNEIAGKENATYKENFVSVDQYVMVKAMKDTMVFPNEGEHWGHFKDGTYDAIPMNQTKWYQGDTFGLQTMDKAGKIHFETTAGNHLQFTETQLFGWIDKYFPSA